MVTKKMDSELEQMANAPDDPSPSTGKVERGTARALYNFGMLGVPEDIKRLRQENAELHAKMESFFRAFANIFKSAGGEAEKFLPSKPNQHK